MQKPSNYDSVQVGYIPVELGGHTAVIKRVKETQSRTGKPMVQIAIDFDQKDSQPGFFTDAYHNDDRPDKKWPYQGTQYILTEDQDGKCSRNFKSFITSVETSNGVECAWGAGFEKWFVGKKVGVVYGESEEEYDGEVKIRRRIRYFCSYDKAATAPVPERKLLKTLTTTVARPSAESFMNVPDDEEEVPF